MGILNRLIPIILFVGLHVGQVHAEESSDVSDYTFSVLRELSSQEISELEEECRTELDQLLERYFSQYNLAEDFPSSADDFDLVRGSWLLDERGDRPEYSSVVRAVGFGFGQLLATNYGFSWALIQDPYGELISMTRHTEEYESVSISPFDYVEKREQTQSVEVFKDFFEQVAPQFLGDSAQQ
jgi:hypothetical protein